MTAVCSPSVPFLRSHCQSAAPVCCCSNCPDVIRLPDNQELLLLRDPFSLEKKAVMPPGRLSPSAEHLDALWPGSPHR